MNPRTLLALGAALVATVGGTALIRQREPESTDFIILLDARRDASAPLEQVLPVIKQLERMSGAKVVVRAAASVKHLREYGSAFEEFDRTRDASEALPIYFALDRPYTDTKKALRSAVDDRASLHGASRVQLLKRLIVVRDTERLNERAECEQLGEDVAYAKWNFLGIGLIVQDSTVQELKKCINVLAPAT